MPFLLGCVALIVLDLYLSAVRLRTYGPRVELNPVARQLASDFGPTVGIVFLGIFNAGLLGLVAHSPTLLHVFFGLKLGLALMQLKSLQLETYIERILRNVKAKHIPR